MPTASRRPTASAASAFTLVEIMVALAVFSMLVGAVFVSVTAVTRASALLAVEQAQSRRLDAFFSWCRKGFRNVSARSEVLVRTRDAGAAGRAVELHVRNSPGAFSMGEIDALGGDIVLGAVPDGRGAAAFSMARIPGGLQGDEIDRELARAEWLPILDGIRTLRWGFWNPSEEKFAEEWGEGSGLPEMIRLELALETGEQAARTFRLPKIQAPPAVGEDEESQDSDEEPRPGPSPGPNPPEDEELPVQ